MDVTDHAYAYLLRCAIPMMVAPPGQAPAVQLRGIVRPGPDHARVVLAGRRGSVAVQYPLAMHDGHPTGTAILDHARYSVVPVLDSLPGSQSRDSFGHAVVEAADFDPATSTGADHERFSLLSMLVHGGGFPWFEDTFTLAGFVLGEDQMRMYLRVTETGITYGADLPLYTSDGAAAGFTALPQEITAFIHSGDFTGRLATGTGDDYCAAVVDLNAMVG